MRDHKVGWKASDFEDLQLCKCKKTMIQGAMIFVS